MRRLLPAFAVLAAILTPLGAKANAPAQRVPSNASVVQVTLSFPPAMSTHKTVRRTFTHGAATQLVAAANGLQRAVTKLYACPMYMRLAPELTVVYRAGSAEPALAEAQVQVALGNRGNSGSTACFPIHFSVRGRPQPTLLGNSYVRLVGRMIGVPIS